jgi:hypothetical protein
MDRTWVQDGVGSGRKRLFCCCGAAAQLVRCLPAVQPAPLRQDTPLVAAKFGSTILEPNLQENFLVTMTFSMCIPSNTTRQILLSTHYIGDMFRLTL